MKVAPQDIIIAPVITEESLKGIAGRKYTFKVAPNAGKIEIARAVEELFDVQVAKVNTITVRGQFRRQGLKGGYTSGGKKAIVTLKQSSKGIEFFETMT